MTPGSTGSVSHHASSARQCPGRAALCSWLRAAPPARQLLLTCDNVCLFSWNLSSKGLMFNSLQSLWLQPGASAETLASPGAHSLSPFLPRQQHESVVAWESTP